MSQRYLVSSFVLDKDSLNARKPLALLGKAWVESGELIIKGLLGKVSKFNVADLKSYSLGIQKTQFAAGRILVLAFKTQMIAVSCTLSSSTQALLTGIQKFYKEEFDSELPCKAPVRKVQNNNLDDSELEVESHTDSSISYFINKKEKTCTCPDFIKVRANLVFNDPGRLCKHLAEKLFKDHIPSYAIKGGFHKPPEIDANATYKLLEEFVSAVKEQFVDMGWHVEVGHNRFSIHEKFKNGKPMKGEYLALYYEELSNSDSYVTADGVFQKGYRQRPWGITGKKVTTSSWKSLDEAVEVFINMVENRAPNVNSSA